MSPDPDLSGQWIGTCSEVEMRIVFIGATEFSWHMLDELLRNDAEVAAVFSLGPSCGATVPSTQMSCGIAPRSSWISHPKYPRVPVSLHQLQPGHSSGLESEAQIGVRQTPSPAFHLQHEYPYGLASALQAAWLPCAPQPP